MTSKFKEFQQNPCTPEVESPPDISDLCPTCVPDPNYIEPDWWITEQPYLNKKTCEYVTIATVNVDGDIFTHSSISDSGMTFTQLLSSYRQVGLNFMLNYFNKEMDSEVNGLPLLDYVEAKDYHFYSFADSTMVVRVSIPAAVFDVVPEKPESVPVEDLLQREVTVKFLKLKEGLIKLKLALGTYSKFQAIHYQISSSKLVFEKSEEPLYLKFYPARIDKFLSEFDLLLQKNKFSTGLADLNRSPFKIKFEFELSETDGTYKFVNISAQKRLQSMKPLKKGLNGFKKMFNGDPTLNAFISNIMYIDLKLRARRTPTWEEFSSEFVFPKTVMQSKKAAMFNTGLPSLDGHLNGLDDFIFDGLISFTDAFIYNLNRSNKVNLRELNSLPQNLDDFDFRLGEVSFKFGNDRKKEKTKKFQCISDLLKTVVRESDDFLSDMLSRLNPCKLKDLASTAVVCIVGNVEVETAFLAIIKSAFKNMTAEGLDILLQGLPENVRVLIEKEVAIQISGVSSEPWSSEYKERAEQQAQQVSIGNYLSDLPDPASSDSSDPLPSGEERLTALTLLRESATAILKEEEIFKIYEDAVMKFATAVQVMESIQNLPGVDLLTKFLGVGDFPTTHFIKPPIDSFLNSITFDPCGKEFSSLKLPAIPSLNFAIGWDWLKELGKAFIIALKLTIKQVIVSLLAKLASKITIELPSIADIACQGLSLNNENPVSDLLTGRGDLGDILADAIGKDSPNQPVDSDSAAAAIIESTGLIDNSSRKRHDTSRPGARTGSESNLKGPNFDFSRNPNLDSDTRANKGEMPFIELAKAISVSSTREEIIRAITLPQEEQNLNYFRNMANTLPHVVPEFSDSLNTVEKVMKFFMDAGNKLTPDQRDFLQGTISPDDRRQPLEETICLTDEDYKQWERDRQKAFTDSGMDPEIAKDFVNKQNERIKSDLDDLLEVFANGPDSLLKNAIDRALDDDTCENPEALITTEGTPATEIMSAAANSIFKRLQAAFIDDTIEWNFFERLVDSPGILSLILADKKGFTLNYHNAVSDSAILRFFLPDPGELPETVAIQMFNYLNDSKFSNNGKSIVMDYNNQLSDDELFESTITAKNNDKNYNYRVTVQTTNYFTSFMVNQFYEDSREGLNSYFTDIWSGFEVNVGTGQVNNFIKCINNLAFHKLLKKCITRPDGSPSLGFIYSSQIEEITKSDLEYVGPNGEEYDYEEEQAILGRSATNNPRVTFLDPGEHGGSYRRPKYYIEPQKHEGWRGLAKIFVPNSDNKGDPLTFLHIPNVVKIMEKTMNSLDSDERLQLAPQAIAEPPFDKIANPSTLATIEGVIVATIRTYLTDYFIRSMPIVSNVMVGNKNYDDSMVEMIVENMQEGMISQTSSRRSVYTGYVYWLLFLEQAAQLFDRKYNSHIKEINKKRDEGLSKEMADLEDRLSKYNLNVIKIRAAQENFQGDIGQLFPHLKQETTWSLEDPKSSSSLERQIEIAEKLLQNYKNAANTSEAGETKGFSGKIEEQEMKLKDLRGKQAIHEGKKSYGDNVVRGCLLMAYGRDYWRWLGLSREDWLDNITPSPISKVEDQYGFSVGTRLSVDFSNINLNDANFASKIFSIQTVEKDCKQVLKFLVKEQIDYYAEVFAKEIDPHVHDIHRFFFGSSEVFKNMPSIGTKDETFDNIKNCVINPQKQNPFDNLSMTTEELEEVKKNGSFFFEKYVRVTDKEGSPLFNRDQTLKGVVNPEHFMKFIKDKRNLIDEKKPVSEYFGDPRIKAGIVVGSIGIKFGIRLCYMPPTSFITLSENQTNKKLAMNEKSFLFKEVPTLPESKYIFPICSYEEDIPDEPMLFYLNLPDENFNQEISCYIDRLFESKGYDLIFNKAINLKKIPSLLSVYSYTNFLNAIGIDGGEREDSDESAINSNNMGRIFNDCKKELKKLFINSYKRDNFDPSDDDNREDQAVKSKNKKLKSTLDHVVISQDVPWFYRLNKVFDNPFIGFMFGNKYFKMFDLVKPEEEEE